MIRHLGKSLVSAAIGCAFIGSAFIGTEYHQNLVHMTQFVR
ncbi:hypothetical protein [Endozoicomonas sp. SESOKO1]